MKKFRRSLIVGKFSPLHLGHHRLIEMALSECEEVIIFSYTNPEITLCESEKRLRWLNEIFPKAQSYVFNPKLTEIPFNDESAETHRHFVAQKYLNIIGKPLDAIYVGEDYAFDFAKVMTLELAKAKLQTHDVTPVILDRTLDPAKTSATHVRSDIHRFKYLLSPFVYGDFVQTICFFGAESTGKSTLSKYMAQIYHTEFVDEYGRTLWEEKNGNLVFDDFVKIAKTQLKNEQQKRQISNRFLFADTSPLTTLFYCYSYFKKADIELEVMAQKKYDLVFLCQPDFPLVQDGTRSDEVFRKNQHEWYLKELSDRKINYFELAGSLNQRSETIKRHIKEHLK